MILELDQLTFQSGSVLHTTCHAPRNLFRLNFSADNCGTLESGGKICGSEQAMVREASVQYIEHLCHRLLVRIARRRPTQQPLHVHVAMVERSKEE